MEALIDILQLLLDSLRVPTHAAPVFGPSGKQLSDRGPLVAELLLAFDQDLVLVGVPALVLDGGVQRVCPSLPDLLVGPSRQSSGEGGPLFTAVLLHVFEDLLREMRESGGEKRRWE